MALGELYYIAVFLSPLCLAFCSLIVDSNAINLIITPEQPFT